MNELEKNIKGMILDKLEDGYDIEKDSFDTTFALFKDENVVGSVDCSVYEARQWIGEYFNELAEVVKDYEAEFGEKLNPFEDAEIFQVKIVLFLACNILSDVWEEGITKEELKRRLE